METLENVTMEHQEQRNQDADTVAQLQHTLEHLRSAQNTQDCHTHAIP